MKPFFDYVANIHVGNLYALAAIIVYVYLAERHLLPSAESIRKLTSMLDDRGGNILVLGLMTSWFFIVTVKLFYYAIHMISNGVIHADDAILLMALNTVSSSAFGTCFGALLKTLNGNLTVAPPSALPASGDRRQAPRITGSVQMDVDLIGSPPGVARNGAADEPSKSS